jgi:hypothetical protein
MADYPVSFSIRQPEKFDRAHVVIRLLIVIILSVLAGASGWIPGLVYLGIPVLAAVLISQKGAETYLAEADGTMTRWLRYIVGFYAYLALLTDKLPSEAMEDYLEFRVTPGGNPSTGNALVRIILALPSAIVLALRWIVGIVLGLIAAILILVQESYPAGIYDFLRGLMRWEARLLAYLASLVEEYPPFALDTGETETPAAPA